MNALLLKLAPYAVLGGAVFGLKHCYDTDVRNKAVAAERGKVATDFRDSIAVAIDSVRKTFKQDTIKLTKTIVQRVPVVKEVEKFIEKQVPVPFEVVKELIRVDSQVIAQCQVVRLTCQEENRLLKLDLIKSEDQTRAALSLQPSFGRQVTTHTVAGLIGAAVCHFWLCPKEPK